jgi:hypothetical protein
MPVTFTGIVYGSLALSATTMPNPAFPIVRTFASAPRTCAVLQAAYTAAIKYKVPAYPVDVRADSRALSLDKMVPDYRTELTASQHEFEELIARQDLYSSSNFKPTCTWNGVPGPLKDNEGHATYVTFTSPIFSKNGRLSIVQISFREAGMFGYGLICMVRSKRGVWSAQCLDSWIT